MLGLLLGLIVAVSPAGFEWDSAATGGPVTMQTYPRREIKSAAFSQVMRRSSGREGYSLRAGRWRYTEWDADNGTVRQLFDEEADAAESTDLVARPEHAARVAEFQRLIATQREQGR